jgi:2-polyprenyl-3-methyl-5-hydroxy-6-metoxy-1,4-benzoquinol methylase
MKVLHTRAYTKEILDDLECAGEAVSQNLKELDIINELLGGNKVSLNALKAILKHRPDKKHWKIADLGCGSGHLMLALDNVFRKKNMTTEFTGYDANPFIVNYAKHHCANVPTINFICQNVLTNEISGQYDIVHAALFLHHFTEEELIGLLSKLREHVTEAIIINDLHRHPLAYYSIKILTRLFSRSYLVKNDAALSVAKGFTKKEWKNILLRAGYKAYSINWVWAFRHQLILFPASAQ